MSAGAKLRELLERGELIQAPGVFNPILARMVERAGFPAVYISGAGLANGQLGLPDVGLMSMTEVTRMAGAIASATSLPCICDADTGYGGPAMIRRAVGEFIKQGVAGIHIEDQIAEKRCGHLSGKLLATTEIMQDRIRSACDGRTDGDFVIIARTDARDVEGFDGAVARARAYLEAGADMIFPEALESAQEFARFAKAIDAPILANMTEFGKSPLLTQEELKAAGVSLAIYPQTCFRVMMKAARDALGELKSEGSQKSFVDRMQTRLELYELLDYRDWRETGNEKSER